MILGFTGTRGQLLRPQMVVLDAFVELRAPDVTEGHHGDCTGGDAYFDRVLEKHGIKRVAHPGYDERGHSKWREYCQAEVILPSKPYLMRNRDIVDVADEVLACPAGAQSIRGSGTWYTIRHAIGRGRLTTIIMPNGSVEIHNESA